MYTLNRRRFIAISASCLALPAAAAPLQQWRGTALGSAASIHLAHPEAKAIIARAVAEIDRLEDVFSLYRAGSALSRLNRDGGLVAPPFELLECLSLAGLVHQATGGLFDPTIQPLWALYATSFAAGDVPGDAAIAAAQSLTGWEKLGFDNAEVKMPKGMALTLNGIAQGYVADRVAQLLRDEGLGNILINTGELRALGGQPDGGAWPVSIAGAGKVALSDRALATSSPLGTVFDAEGRVGHILHPATGRPAKALWRGVSISADSAALADALSTAACLMDSKAAMQQALTAFPEARLEAVT